MRSTTCTTRSHRLTLAILGLCLTVAACGGGSGPTSPDLIKVFRSDNSTQCNNDGRSVAADQQELVNAGIDVICGQKGNDGEARGAQCGNGTGDINVFTINRQNQPDAESLGFGPVGDLPNYQDSACAA